MKITLIQGNLQWNDPLENIRRMDDAMRHHAGTDLFVLPEMFATGFCIEPEKVAEAEGGLVHSWMRRRAGQLNAAVAGSLAVKTEDGMFRNRFYLVEPNGTVSHYDKHHLFAPGGEAKAYNPGTKRTIITYRGVRILPLVCYDLRFPVWARYQQDYDLILCVAAWPAKRIGAWDTLLRARAIENQCYVAGVNCVGTYFQEQYNGHSVLIDPRGRVLAEAPTDGLVCELSGVVDMEVVRSCRESFPVWKDSDFFYLV